MPLIMLMGLPASGKTILAKKLEKELNYCKRITFDEWEKSILEGSLKEKHLNIFQHVKEELTLNPTLTIILDDTMHLAGMRKAYWKLSTVLMTGICFIRISITTEEAICRDAVRSNSFFVGESSILKIANLFDPLTTEQKEYYINITDDNPIDIDTIKSLLHKSAK